jgi:hypothetical protein
MGGPRFAVFALAVCSIGALGGCNQDSYSSTPSRDTHMGDVRAAENPWIAEPSSAASGTPPTPPDPASANPGAPSAPAPMPSGPAGAAMGSSSAK